MAGRPCIVLVDPSTGLETFATECDRSDVGLIVVSTEQTRRFPDYFQRPQSADLELALDSDAARVPDLVERLRREYDVREVCAGDEAAVPVAELANRVLLGTRANDPASTTHRVSKAQMYRVLRERGFRLPASASFALTEVSSEQLQTSTRSWRYPVIVKPVECAGSVCTVRVDAPQQLGGALARVRQERTEHLLSEVSSEFLLQEFVQGPEYLVNAYSVAGRHVVTGVYSYTKFMNYDVPVYQSVNFNGVGAQEREVLEYVKEVLDHLGVRQGLTNTDLIVGEHGPQLLEINARIVGFGGALSRLERVVLGRNQATLVVDHARGVALGSNSPEGVRAKLVFLQSRFDRPMGTPSSARVTALESYVEHAWWKRPGDRLRDARSYLNDTVGYVSLAHRDAEVLRRDFETLTTFQDRGVLF